MTDLPLHLITETATAITLGWTPPQGCVGYVFYNGSVKSHTLDGSRSSVKFAKAGPYKVNALGTLALGVYPPVAAPSFGHDLPARQVKSPGPLFEVTTVGGSVMLQPGRIMKLTAPVDLGGRDLILNCVGTAQAPCTIDLAAPVSNGRILISRAAYLNLRFVELGHSPIDGIKITDGSHHIDVDGRGGRIHHTARQGFLQTDAACYDWQVWNAYMDDCGTAEHSNLDHANYVHDARGKCVLGNIIVTSPYNYGFQFYSDCRDLIATGCESHGTKNGRGGFVIGNEPGLTTSNVRVYGPIISGSPVCMDEYNTATNCRAYDGVSINSGGFDPAFQPVNCITAQSPTAAKGHVQAARHGMHPTHDIDGKPFTTADAGARAL